MKDFEDNLKKEISEWQENRGKGLKEAVDLGRRARETKQYLETNPYLMEVLDRIRFNLLKSIMSLKSHQKEEFAAMKVAYDMVNEPITYMNQDILIGDRAATELTTGQAPGDGGIL